LIHEAKLSDRLPDARDVPDLMHRVSVDDGSASQFLACSIRGLRHSPLLSAKKKPP